MKRILTLALLLLPCPSLVDRLQLRIPLLQLLAFLHQRANALRHP